MPITVSPNAQHDVPITNFGRNELHYTIIFSNQNETNPTCCGLFTVSKAPETNTFTLPCTAFVIVLEGKLDVEDQAKPGKQINLKAGDIVRLNKGTVAKWTSPSYGKAFFSAEAAADVNPYDHLVC